MFAFKKNNNNLIVIISGPSGVGKGTIRKKLIKNKELNLVFSVSFTTRPKRDQEEDGVDYFFISKKEFEEAIKKGDFLEFATFVGNYYGTNKKVVYENLEKNKNVLLEIEIEGFKQIVEKIGKENILSFFLITPNFKELESRIMKRSTEDKDAIRNRLLKAREEIKYKDLFDYVIVNDDIDESVNEISNIIKKTIDKKNLK